MKLPIFLCSLISIFVFATCGGCVVDSVFCLQVAPEGFLVIQTREQMFGVGVCFIAKGGVS